MNKEKSLDLYTQLFFLKLSEKLSQSFENQTSLHHDNLLLLRNKIYNQPQNPWSVEGLAHELAMSASRFEHLYKEMFGISVMNDVIHSRIEYAIYLLTTTDIAIKQIAELCGYKSDIHFMRQFKSRKQMTPSQFRKESKKR